MSTLGNSLGTFGEATGALTTGFSIPTGITFHAGELYVAIQGTHRVMRFDSSGSHISDFVPQLSGGLRNPKDLVFGPDGALYVTSSATDEVIKYDGTSSSFLGVFANTNLDEPAGIEFDFSRDLVVVNTGNNTVVKFEGPSKPSPGTFIATFDTGGDLSNPIDVIVGPIPPLPELQPPTAVIQPGSIAVQSGETGITFDGSSSTAGEPSRPITSYSWVQISGTPVSGLTDPSQPSITFTAPTLVNSSSEILVFQLTVDDGQFQDMTTAIVSVGEFVLYASSPASNQIKLYNTDGDFIANFVDSGVGGIASPRGIAFDSQGNLYAVSAGNNRVVRYDSTGTPLHAEGKSGATFIDDPAISGSYDLTFSPNTGNLLLSFGNEVREYDKDDGSPLGIFGDAHFDPATQLQNSQGLRFNPTGSTAIPGETELFY